MQTTHQQLLELTINRITELDTTLRVIKGKQIEGNEQKIEHIKYELETLKYVKDLLLYGHTRCDFIK